ncbi:CLUMA_CG016915, isoform A [Clunio marinus]|uniref:CLUMA_CG016915, isoform A n=1 Tax=Clunio marinus TaxID=568069 RepID=A0A1J1IV43_9DIPT|nr:CLUMA_CG016915, isoform A [Clunio marinus]
MKSHQMRRFYSSLPTSPKPLQSKFACIVKQEILKQKLRCLPLLSHVRDYFNCDIHVFYVTCNLMSDEI